MIHDVDESLRQIVKRDVLNGSTNVEISFEAPTTEWASRRNTPTLNVYLYDIREDTRWRQVMYQEVRDERGLVAARKTPDRRFKLSYLVTAWTQRPEDEHRLLSSVMTAFLRFNDVMADGDRQGSLTDVGGEIQVTVALPPPEDRAISDIWSALGGELKPSLDLVVSMPFPTGHQMFYGPPVVEQPRIRISGNGAAAAIPGGDDADGDEDDAEGTDKGERTGKKRRRRKLTAAEEEAAAAAAAEEALVAALEAAKAAAEAARPAGEVAEAPGADESFPGTERRGGRNFRIREIR